MADKVFRCPCQACHEWSVGSREVDIQQATHRIPVVKPSYARGGLGAARQYRATSYHHNMQGSAKVIVGVIIKAGCRSGRQADIKNHKLVNSWPSQA